MSKYRIENNSSTIEEIKTFIKEHLYKDSYDDDEPYFINVKLDKDGMPILGNGSEKNPLHIHCTSRHLMNNLSFKGVHHIDATYKITTYGFPLIVYGVSDSEGKFHPVSFMISSHETQQDFTVFYQGLIKEAEKLDINYEPEIIMQDACPASRNAILDFFPNVKFLMCYFHVKKNVRDHKNLLKDKDAYKEIMKDLTSN